MLGVQTGTANSVPLSYIRDMQTFDPREMTPAQTQRLLQGIVAPRPIALASTVNRKGEPNLSPFSFFNIFSSNPPILVFSPARRMRNNTTKDPLNNVLEVPEVVIHAVSYAMVEQTSLASSEYPTGTNEFIKAGFTMAPSELVRPYRVVEAPAALECKVNEVIALGDQGGAGHLVVCEVLKIHVDPKLLNDAGEPDPFRMDLVARLGGDWYARASGEALFSVEKPITTLGIGVDALPKALRDSLILTGNDLGRLGNVTELPTPEEIEEFAKHHRIDEIERASDNGLERRIALHQYAHELLEKGKVHKAWKALAQDPLSRP